MNTNIEKIVPCFYLCNLVPRGNFKDCLFAWRSKEDYWHRELIVRTYRLTIFDVPAPTVQEVMEWFDNGSITLQKGTYYGTDWMPDTWNANKSFSSICTASVFAERAPDAALALWLKLKQIEFDEWMILDKGNSK